VAQVRIAITSYYIARTSHNVVVTLSALVRKRKMKPVSSAAQQKTPGGASGRVGCWSSEPQVPPLRSPRIS
jgi:hypothetical protein